MTLVVYSEGTIYADDCIVEGMGDGNPRRDAMSKLWLNPENNAVVACLGGLPHVLDRDYTFSVVAACAIHYEATQQHCDFPKDIVETLTHEGRSHFYVMTRRALYSISEERDMKARIMDISMDHAFGSGEPRFRLCRRVGMSIRDAYAFVAENTNTVSNNMTAYSQCHLKLIRSKTRPKIPGVM